MKRLFSLCFLIAVFAIPAWGQHRDPVNTYMGPNGRMEYVDYSAKELAKPVNPQIQITQEVVIDFQCVPNPGNPPPGLIRVYCESSNETLTCLRSDGSNACPGGGGGGGGGGSVASVGLAGPTGIPISGSPVTSSGTLVWAMPTNWILGDTLIGNGANSVARLAGPTTPDDVPQTFISTPASGVATLQQWAKAGLAGRVVSGTTDTILATDRTPKTVQYTSNSSVAVTVPDPGSAGFESNPAFVTIVQGGGAVTFTPQTSAVITWCNGAVCFPGQTSFAMTTGQIGNWSSPDGGNWLVRVTSSGAGGGAPIFNNQCLSGCGVTWTGLLNFTASASTYNIVSTIYSSPQTNVTLTAADPSNPRIDVIAVNTSGAVVVVTGTPAASPSAPTLDPLTQLALTFVTVPAGSTTPTITNITVYDENLTPPTEWTCSGTPAFNCASTNNPFHLTKDVEVTGAFIGGNALFTNSAPITLPSGGILSFNIRNKAVWDATGSISICFLNGSTIVGNCLGFKNGIFGFNQANTTGYQQIVIPLSSFAVGSSVDRLRFQYGGNGTVGFYLDWIQIQTGTSGTGITPFQLQVNNQNTQQTATLNSNGSVTFTKVDTGTLSTITATAVGAPPSGAAGGDLSGTYPNPTVVKVNGASVPASAHLVGTNSSSQIITATQTDVSAVGYVAGGGSANAQTATLAPAITSLTNGLRLCWLPTAPNSTTTPTLAVNGLTAKTIVKTGGAALAASDLTTTAVACVIYDGTNFELQNPQTTSSGGITSINTTATGPNVDVVGAGNTSVSTSGNTVTIFGGTAGSIAGTWQNVAGSSYTVVDGDNQSRLRFTGNSNAITLPQPNTITTNPFVAQRVQSNAQSVSTFTSGSFTPTAGNQLWISIQENDSKDVSSLSLSTGETCDRKSATIATNATFTYYCPSLLGTAKTLTVNFSGVTAGATGVLAVELTGTTDDNSSTIAASGFTSQSLTNPVHFPNAVSMVGSQNGVLPAPPWIETDTLSNANIGQSFYRLLSNVSSVTASVTNSHTLGQSIFSISSHPSFTAGWYFVATNASTTYDTITPTSSTINGQTTLVLAPNQSCGIMSNGANWDAICWSTPNLINNGVAGAATIIYGRDAASQTSAIADFTMTTAPADQPYRFSGNVNCHTSVATATATLNLKYTDVSNTAQTVSVVATCTTLGAASVGDITQSIRAKSGTTITFGVAVANSPNYDVSVRLESF